MFKMPKLSTPEQIAQRLEARRKREEAERLARWGEYEPARPETLPPNVIDLQQYRRRQAERLAG